MNGGVNTPIMKLLLLLQLFRLFSFIHGTPQVIGELNGVIILPCSLTPGEIEVIHWTFEGKKVHSYYEGKDIFNDQDPSYVGRTSLFLGQIKNGNASLQLKNLQKSDEQTYSCYVSATKESKEFTVQLKVEAAVWGEQHKHVTIPCSFNPGEEVVIHWRIANDDSRIVHTYYQGQDMLEKQDKSYKGRTSLILSELAKGNASLQLRDLQKGDVNTYSCYVGTKTGNKEDKVKLYIADFGHSMEYTLDHEELKCYASHVYPSDIVTIEWYEDNHLKQKGISTSSSCISCNLKQHSYKCIIKHSVVQSTWTGVWQIDAPQQDSIKCSCSFCKIVKAGISVRLYLRKNTTEVPVTSLNSSSFVISNGYENRVHKLEEYRLQLNNLTANDNGDYICEIRTSGEMLLAMTSVNITEQNEMHQRNRWILIVPFVSCIVLYCIYYLCKRKKQLTRDSGSQTSS